jgi:FkbM family methyltransferase
LIDLHGRLRPRDARVCALLGGAIGTADFHIVDRLHGLSTTVEHLARATADFGATYRTVRTPVTTLAALCTEQGVRGIDFLKIDVEGGEADVLRGNDWHRFRPKVVVVEALEPGTNAPAWQGWEPYLLAQGYRFALFDTLNRFYVAEEAGDVAARLPVARAPWDAVRHMYEIGRAPENPLHPDHALANALARGFWASLPELDRTLINMLLRRGGGETADVARDSLEGEQFTLALGRIACGYDGGQVIEPER